MRKKTFLKGAAILGIAGIIVQVMGAFFRIPLGNIIGDEGMGYYQIAYPIYIFLLVFSTNGAPAAISKMVSERASVGRYREAHRVFRLSFILMLALGVVSAAVVYFGARPIAIALGSEKAWYSLAAIAPALLFVPVMSVFRGYFQGMQEMGPTAVSQLVEQAVRVIVGIVLAIMMVDMGVEYAAGGACFGTSVGPIAGTLMLAVVYLRKRSGIHREISEDLDDKRESGKRILWNLAYLAVPITIGVSILPIMNMADVAIVVNRLQDTGFTEKAAVSLYGQLSGMTGPIINIPQALALSIALSMVPAVAAAQSTGDKQFLSDNVKLGFRTAMMLGVPCAFGLMTLAEPIMRLLYPANMDSAVNAAPSLALLGGGVIFLAIAQTMAGILQGLDRANAAVGGLMAALAVKVVLTYILSGIPSLNINGAAISSTVAYAVVGLINLYVVKKVTGCKFDLSLTVLRPLVSGIVMAACVWVAYFAVSKVTGNTISAAFSICVGGAVYCAMLIWTRSIAPNEIRALPKGELLYKLFVKTRLIKG